jgi:hypothetical protein
MLIDGLCSLLNIGGKDRQLARGLFDLKFKRLLVARKTQTRTIQRLEPETTPGNRKEEPDLR